MKSSDKWGYFTTFAARSLFYCLKANHKLIMLSDFYKIVCSTSVVLFMQFSLLVSQEFIRFDNLFTTSMSYEVQNSEFDVHLAYYHDGRGVTWTKAKRICEQDSGRLAIASNERLNNVLSDFLGRVMVMAHNNPSFSMLRPSWVGLRLVAGRLTWIDGTIVNSSSFQNWDTSYTAVIEADQEYIAINSDPPYQWRLHHNENSFSFICEFVAPCNGNPNINTCQNNGTCIEDATHNNGRQFYCNCTGTGYTGIDCEVEIDECHSYPCEAGRCIDYVSRYECDCGQVYTGSNCNRMRDYCSSNPCVKGECVSETNGFRCNCLGTDASGTLCEIYVDECVSNPCGGGRCVDGITSYTCDCTDSGFVGLKCEENIDECNTTESFCNHGECVNLWPWFDCLCDDGYTGTRCELDIDECSNATLFCGAAECINYEGGYRCLCEIGLDGLDCQDDIDECLKEDICSGVGTCINDYSNYTCDCWDGYSGARCEVAHKENLMPRERFLVLVIAIAAVTVVTLVVVIVVHVIRRRRRKRFQKFVIRGAKMLEELVSVSTDEDTKTLSHLSPADVNITVYEDISRPAQDQNESKQNSIK